MEDEGYLRQSDKTRALVDKNRILMGEGTTNGILKFIGTITTFYNLRRTDM